MACGCKKKKVGKILQERLINRPMPLVKIKNKITKIKTIKKKKK